VWDLATGKERGKTMPAADPRVLGVAFSADSTRALALGPLGVLQLMDVVRTPSQRRFLPPEGSTFKPTAVGWAGAEQALVGFSDGSVRLFDLRRAREVRVFAGKHDASVSAVAVSADGRRALTGGRDKVVRLWDVATGRELGRFEGHTNWVRKIVFVPGAERALSAGADGTVRCWELARAVAPPKPPNAPAPPPRLQERPVIGHETNGAD